MFHAPAFMKDMYVMPFSDDLLFVNQSHVQRHTRVLMGPDLNKMLKSGYKAYKAYWTSGLWK